MAGKSCDFIVMKYQRRKDPIDKLKEAVLKAVYPDEVEYLDKVRVNIYHPFDRKLLRKRIVYAFKRSREEAEKIVESWMTVQSSKADDAWNSNPFGD